MPKGNVTAAMVATRAGVSKWTVIRAFKNESSIAQDTKEKVLVAAKELSYEPNLLARSLATNQTHQVAILIDDFANPFMLPTLGHLSAKLQDAGYMAVLVNVNENLSYVSAIRSARQRRLDAIVSFGVSFSPKSVIENLANDSGAPLLVLARESTTDRLPSIYTDPEASIEAMGRYLFDRGYRKPLFIGGPKPTSTALGRRRSYMEFWRSRGVENFPEISSPLFDLRTAMELLRDFFRTQFDREKCDVLLCENDILAIAAVDVAKHELGLSIPGDVAIVGFDDITLSSTKAYDLTTIRQPYDQMIDVLLGMITGRTEISSVALPGELVIRGSA